MSKSQLSPGVSGAGDRQAPQGAENWGCLPGCVAARWRALLPLSSDRFPADRRDATGGPTAALLASGLLEDFP
jgi:hypothetical protein